MRIALITPYPFSARNGNAHTAARYARFLRAAGHRVEVMLVWDGRPVDALVALHARRVHASISAFAATHPDRSLILVLTGTDLYRDIRNDASAQESLRLASRIVVLQERGLEELPAEIRAKAVTIYQSAPALRRQPKPVRHFDVCVVAHLRDEKDPFRAAHACALLAPDSRIRVRHIGGDLQIGLAEQARQIEAERPNWRWLGPQPHGMTRRIIARSHLLVISSWMEGGANVICEAVMAGTPVLASDIPGNRGMLGEDYAGYFPPGDNQALAALLLRAEGAAAFYAHLCDQCAQRAGLFEPAREAAAVQALLS
jgi:putative glycosyltransferase (TIGR04348 family)